MVRRKRIQSIVAEILDDCRIRRPAVDVEKIANKLDLKIIKAKTDDDISGFLRRGTGSGAGVIGVNASHHNNRQRFTIAHEIGHHILHAASPFHVDVRFRAFRLGPPKTGEVDREEIEANVFAAELLMPEAFVVRDIRRSKDIDLEGGEDIVNLALKYKVSTQAMTFRLANLGHIKL